MVTNFGAARVRRDYTFTGGVGSEGLREPVRLSFKLVNAQSN